MRARPSIPLPSLRRLPIYHRHALRALEDGLRVLSSRHLGAAAGVPATQVRKDLSHVGEFGRPGVGYNAEELAAELEAFLGLGDDKEAILVGVGNLGRALAFYGGFRQYRLHIVALFDADPTVVGEVVNGLVVRHASTLPDVVRRLGVRIGIITVPSDCAQDVAEAMVSAGIDVIWNFAPCLLRLPDHILVKSEDLAIELATLSHLICGRGIGRSPRCDE